ncbi:hypothetical protein ACN08P_19835 [Photobacterium leiognathi subsp. mandapamensis]|uniref:hypothetical protein n=1 Tax=Photobacterium leiognathi TaxID=553611 RepID=UPI003AF3858D
MVDINVANNLDVNIEELNLDALISNFTDDLFSFTRPSYKTKFVRRGDELHLLVYINHHSKYPFIRIPISELHRAAISYSNHH